MSLSVLKEKILSSAVSTAWLNPHVDLQYLYKPARISHLGGTRRVIVNDYFNIVLPDATNLYVVYQLGQVSPQRLGIDGWVSTWLRMDTLVVRETMLANFHINFRMLPLSSIYVSRSSNGNLLFAVDATINKTLLKSDYELYFRLYSNIWYTLPEADPLAEIEVYGGVVNNLTDAAAVINKFQTLSAANSKNLFLYHNGFYLSKLNIGNVKVGDTVELVYDPSGVGYFDIPIQELPYFESKLDGNRKYIILAPNNGRESKIEFMDDLEVYVCSKEKDSAGNDQTVGVYYSRHNVSDLRMLTRRDYAIDTRRISTIVYQQGERLNYRECFLRFFLRDAGYQKSPPKDANLIDDLYLLDRDTRMDVMSGANSVIPQWEAVNLEQSPYSLWMGRDRHSINYENLKGVISWHGLYDIAQSAVFQGNSIITPPLMLEGGVMYTFDSLGLLLEAIDITPAQGKASFIPVNPNVVKAFFIPGTRSYLSADIESLSVMTRDPASLYEEARYYKIGTNEWSLAKEGVDYTRNTTGEVTWMPMHTDSSRLKRTSGTHYRRELTITPNDITKEFPLFHDGSYPPSGIPMGRLEIWMEGRHLIFGVDYYYNNRTFRIFNRSYYTDAQTSIKLHLLYYGLPSLVDSPKRGFVQHRLVNYDNTYDLAPYRNKDIYVDGYRVTNSEIDFSERRLGTMQARFREGAPYSIQNVVGAAPTRLLNNLVETRSENLDDEKYISDYLSKYKPELEIPGPVIIPSKHHIVSVLIHTLLEDIDSNILGINFSDMSPVAVDFALKPYRHLIDIDVCKLDIDFDFVQVRPTGRTSMTVITANEYAFLQKVITTYLNNRVILNTSVLIG